MVSMLWAAEGGVEALEGGVSARGTTPRPSGSRHHDWSSCSPGGSGGHCIRTSVNAMRGCRLMQSKPRHYRQSNSIARPTAKVTLYLSHGGRAAAVSRTRSESQLQATGSNLTARQSYGPFEHEARTMRRLDGA